MTDEPVKRRSTRRKPPSAHVDLEEMFQRILASQQPFFQGMLNQMSSIESRVAKIDGQTQANATQASVDALRDRIVVLEYDKTKLAGIRDLFVWAPRLISYAGIALILFMQYLSQHGGKFP